MLANNFGPGMFGQYTYVLVLGALYSQLITWGTQETGIRLYTSFGKLVLSSILTVKLINFVLITIILSLYALFKFESIYLLGLVASMNALSYSTQYETKKANVPYAKIYFIERVLISMLILLSLTIFNIRHIGYIFFIMFSVQLLSLAYQALDNREFKVFLNFRDICVVYLNGVWLLVFSISKYSFGGISRIIIFSKMGDASLGLFAAAWQFVPLSTIYYSQAIKAWRLKITECIDRGEFYEFKSFLMSLSLSVFLPAFLGFAVFFAFGHSILGALFDASFGSAADLMPYVGAYFIVVAADTVVLLLAVAIKKSGVTSIIYLIFGFSTVLYIYISPSADNLTFFISSIIIGHCMAVFCSAVFVGSALRQHFISVKH